MSSYDDESNKGATDNTNQKRPSSTHNSVRKQVNLAQRSNTALPFGNRCATGFEIKQHYSHKSIYSNLSSNYAIKRKYVQFRSKSTVNFMKRPFSTYSAIKTPNEIFDDDEIDTKPKRSFWQLLRIGTAYFGIEVLFSLEIALTVPILLKLRVPDDVYSLVYFLSPLIGFLLQPVLGVMSDRCTSRFGRRRPFIFVLGIGSYIGISLILNGYLIGQNLGDKNTELPRIAIILTALGVTFLDFSADSSDSPLRAFLLDVCNTEDQDTGLNIHAFLGGMGSALGYVLSAIQWDKTFLKFIGDDLQILFAFATAIFIISLIITLTSVKETPLVLNQTESVPLLSGNAKNITELPDDIAEESNQIAQNENNDGDDDDEEDENDNMDQPVSLKLLFKSVLKMPKELIRLLICQLFGFLAFFASSLFFTDFIGQSIYKGNPQAPVNSTSFALYNEGVKMGCWCLLSYSVMSAISAVVLEKFLLTRFSTKTLYFFTYLIYAICCGIIYFQTSVYVILPLSSSMGMLLTTITTLPYQMLSEFHQDKNYRNQSAAGTKRGLGIDCSLLSSTYFLAQTIIAACMGFITAKFGNYVIVLIASVISLMGCFWVSIFVIFPEEKANTNQKK